MALNFLDTVSSFPHLQIGIIDQVLFGFDVDKRISYGLYGMVCVQPERRVGARISCSISEVCDLYEGANSAANLVDMQLLCFDDSENLFLVRSDAVAVLPSTLGGLMGDGLE